MSCFNNCYLPQPPRDWSRVQNICSYENNVPYKEQTTIEMLNKGNILQYKANSGNLTKSQRYSKIAKGQWVNRNTTWATQSLRGYTNPNVSNLKRTGFNVSIDPITDNIIGTTITSPTCPQIIKPIYPVLPSNTGGGSDIIEPNIPPSIPPTPGSDTFPEIQTVNPPNPIVIKDGGILICSIQENICTGETISTSVQQLCHPTTDSDVPGKIQELCWNDGTQTWYPRQRYVMSNSSNKWPINAKLIGAIKIYPPNIISITYDLNIVTIVWIFNTKCLPASNFNIFQNNLLVKSVSGNVFTTTLTVDTYGYYQYYMTSENITAKITSDISNIVEINLTS